MGIVMNHCKKIAIAVDQLFNALCGGWPDETLSSRAYRWHVAGIRSWPLQVIDFLCFWEKDHCKSSYESERQGRHFPPELRL